MRTDDPVVAVLCADVHLSVKCPSARLEEPSWFDAMRRTIKQLRKIAERYDAPILCAGDLFDRWDSPPELINWALKYLPEMHAIPGNHDLPHHRPELMHRSAFGTTIAAGRVRLIDEQTRYVGDRLDVCGRILGERVPSCEMDRTRLKVLLTHEFLWIDKESGFDGVSKDRHLDAVAEEYSGFDVVVVGDNHQPWSRKIPGGPLVWNCGGLMRRKTSDKFLPRVGLLHASGIVDSHELSLEGEKLAEPDGKVASKREAEERSEAVASFVDGLAALEAEELSFRDAIIQAMDARGVAPDVRVAMLAALEEEKP